APCRGVDAVVGGASQRGALTAGHGLAVAERASSWRDVLLARPAAWPLVRHDSSALEVLAAPYAGVLLTVHGDGEAGQPKGAGGAQRLGPLNVEGRVGEPQLGVVSLTRQLRRDAVSGVSGRAW